MPLSVTICERTQRRKKPPRFYVSEVDKDGKVIRHLAGPYSKTEPAEQELRRLRSKTGKARTKVLGTPFEGQKRI